MWKNTEIIRFPIYFSFIISCETVCSDGILNIKYKNMKQSGGEISSSLFAPPNWVTETKKTALTILSNRTRWDNEERGKEWIWTNVQLSIDQKYISALHTLNPAGELLESL